MKKERHLLIRSWHAKSLAQLAREREERIAAAKKGKDMANIKKKNE